MRGPAARPIVVAAGGTGGHFFPAEALAATLRGRGHRVVLMTDARTGRRLGQDAGGETHVLRGAGVAGRGALRASGAMLSLSAGAWQARGLLRRLDAACIVGFGGYPSIPPLLAARTLRRRPAIVLHEQNAVLGRANRLLARMADVVALGFAQTARLPHGTATVFTGNPVRSAIRALSQHPYAPPGERIGLLVLGGSLGARVFSDVVPAAIALLPATLRARMIIVQQCREEDIARVRAAYDAAGIAAELDTFFGDVAERLAAAHLVISRAGASSCAELAVAGRPAILVPLPGAIDDHQSANARALTGAHVIRQADFLPAALAQTLGSLLADPHALSAAAQAVGLAGRPGAADDLADTVDAAIMRAEAPR